MSTPNILQNDLTYALDKTIREVGIISANGIVKNEGKVRFIITGSGGSNLIRITARIIGQEDWTQLVDLTGNVNQLVDVFTWDFLRVECIVYDATSDSVRLNASSFNSSAIGGIEVPGGDIVSNFDTINFTSSDSSITITGDNLTGEIDFISNIVGGVTSVNTRTGDVVLGKTDVNLGNVDNTSDADKPISDDTQDALTLVDGRLDSLEEINSVTKFHAFEDNLQVYADAAPGKKDPLTNIYSNGLVRDGWYFKNTVAGQKINWYFFDGTTQGIITLTNFSAYAVMTFDAITAYPILAVYTFPTGSGDIIPGFAHSKVVYSNPLTPAAVAGVKYLIYFGNEPAAHPELPRINLTYSTISSGGSQNPAEIVLTSSFGSDSAETVNEVQFLVETLGVNSPIIKQEMNLRIKSAIQSDLNQEIQNRINADALKQALIDKNQANGYVGLNSATKIDSIYLPSYVDDVLEFPSLLDFPLVGATGIIYVALDTNICYRWSGSIYIEISPAPVVSVNSKVGAVVLDKTDIGLGSVDNTTDISKPISTATQTALNLITGVTWTGDYDNGRTYTVGEGVMFNGASFRMISFIGAGGYAPPSYPGSWLQVTDYVSPNDIGLGNVDNTSDLNKVISSATQLALNDKENLANKSIDGTLASNSDTLYPSQKAVKTYVDSTSGVATANFEASTYYHELHVNFDYLGAISDGSPYKPFKTIQTAVNAAQLRTEPNTAILIHLKKDTVVTENVVVSNAPSNLYIAAAIQNNTDSSPIKITGSLTISGTSTTRVRVKDLQFAPTSGYALIVNDSNGRHMFQNCQFSNGAIPALAGTGVNLTSTYKNFIEFIDCTIEGVLNIAGSPNAGTTVSLYRCRLGYANVIINSSNVAVGMYDTYGLYSLNHTAGALAIFGLWGMASAFNSTASLSATNFISISNASLQKYDLSFVPLNKTGTCFYQLSNVLRGETADVLNGTRTVFGPTATDAGYKMGTSGNWPVVVSNVAGALDSLAANKIAITEKAAINGVASLDGTGKVPLSQLPASLNDVLEFADLAAFPVTGTAETIYIALDTNKIYRWNITVYTELSPSSGGVTDHGLLTGLADDDHTQYHTDARGDLRYYTKSQVDALIAEVSSAGDIGETSFNISNSQTLPDDVTSFLFLNAEVRGFTALVTVEIDATTDLFEEFTLNGIQKAASWGMSIESQGDDSGVVFSITSSGQIQYTSDIYMGFVSGIIKFRAITTSI
jgi:hypothetical protein